MSRTLIVGVQVFDGHVDDLSGPTNVLVDDNVISAIDAALKPADEVTVVDGEGGVLTPGMIDNHWHALFATLAQADLLSGDLNFVQLVAAQANRAALLRGFTTTRDVGGNVFGLKRATDLGVVDGPRIYPSGPFISQTSGHGDFRGPYEVPTHPCGALDYFSTAGMTLMADGVPQVLLRCREALRMGATQLKVMAGGGVSSLYDPLDTRQYTFEEMAAAVDVARSWNTYVAVHAMNDASVQMCLDAGVLSIEHGFLLSEETLQMMADKGAWLSIQPILDDEDAIPFPDPVSRAKFVEATNGTERVYRTAKELGMKIAFGTDTLFDAGLAEKQGKLVTKLGNWFTPGEALKMVTHDNAQLLKLCGPRDPYPGKLGVVEVGALADLLIWDGNPLADLSLIADPQTNLRMVMKDGQLYKS
ncbi:amidohydrolase family protein [Mycobacterium sp. Y57]|uniref:metal-dependent hydrolase family protein n=1 Tax=Mycolicibacterium xanthum TaxID=2796469 RepID=UPI001C858C97|nr:amidohydrolase family protein [Mycolicibacterium xanthum]MBX7433691.1 amidohydrolase family protein [Mycolicibacterium xanthum]